MMIPSDWYFPDRNHQSVVQYMILPGKFQLDGYFSMLFVFWQGQANRNIKWYDDGTSVVFLGGGSASDKLMLSLIQAHAGWKQFCIKRLLCMLLIFWCVCVSIWLIAGCCWYVIGCFFDIAATRLWDWEGSAWGFENLQKGMDPLLLQVGQGTAAPGQESGSGFC